MPHERLGIPFLGKCVDQAPVQGQTSPGLGQSVWTLSPTRPSQSPLWPLCHLIFPKEGHTPGQDEIHYSHQREWQPVSQPPLQTFPLKPRLSLAPSLPHPV